MSEITADQYRVSTLLDTIAADKRAHAEEVLELKLNQAVEVQNLRSEIAQLQAQVQDLKSEISEFAVADPEVVEGEVVSDPDEETK